MRAAGAHQPITDWSVMSSNSATTRQMVPVPFPGHTTSDHSRAVPALGLVRHTEQRLVHGPVVSWNRAAPHRQH